MNSYRRLNVARVSDAGFAERRRVRQLCDLEISMDAPRLGESDNFGYPIRWNGTATELN